MAIRSLIKEKMTEARQFIQAGQYEQARAILVGVNHPTAIQWIDKIDNILGDPFPQPSEPSTGTSQPVTASYSTKAIVAFVLLWTLFVPGYAATIIWHNEGKRAQRAIGHPLPGVGMLGVMKWFGHCVFVLAMLFVLLVITIILSFPDRLTLG